MKRVSFEVAKALKEAGYPQDKSEYDEGYAISKVYYDVYCSRDDRWHPSSADIGRLLSFDDDFSYPEDCGEYCVAPTYMEAWLWLWREKKSCIGILFDDGNCAVEIWQNKSIIRDLESKFDPEEAIVKAIDYLVKNNLIK